MESALRITTSVLPGKRVVIEAPELIEGQTVEVILMLGGASQSPHGSVLDIVEQIPRGVHVFATPAEADRYLDEERNSWDR